MQIYLTPVRRTDSNQFKLLFRITEKPCNFVPGKWERWII